MGDYRKLRVWTEALELAVVCYPATSDFPRTERFGITSQIRRASVSISANIAEGSGRKSDRDFVRFLRIAGGSANEIEALLSISQKLGYLPHHRHTEIQSSISSIRRQLAGLERALSGHTGR